MKESRRIKSMTGFGRGRAKDQKCSCYCEAKSVNHRYLEVNTKVPDEFNQLEPEIKKIIKSYLSRGAVYLNMNFVYEEGMDLKIDNKLFQKLLRLEKEIASRHGIAQPLNIHYILSYPGVVRQARPQVSFKEKRALVNEALKIALESLVKSRAAEGRFLRKDLIVRLGKIESGLKIIEGVEKERENALLQQRQNNLLQPQPITGIGYPAAVASVNEEVVRLNTHIKTARKLIEKGGIIGRELDFLAQEMNREINTISAKANSGKTARFAVQIKSEIEKIREQALNIE